MLCMACIFPSGNESLSVELTVKPDVSRRNDSAGEITSWEGRRSRRCIPLEGCRIREKLHRGFEAGGSGALHKHG
jgi:hypothetical protein